MSSTQSSLFEYIHLNSGSLIPQIGLGVYKSAPGNETYDAVLNSIHLGYRHIDTAQIYQNEEDVGRAIKDSGVSRDDIYITTKLWLSNFGYDNTINAIKSSLWKLKISYVNLILLHAPGNPELRVETWKALEDLQRQGLIIDIGVSNFGIPHLEKLFLSCHIKPVVNQIELHPWLQRKELVNYCKQHNIIVQAYSPLAKATQFNDVTLKNISIKLSLSPAQILIAYSIHKGFVTLPKSINKNRQLENLNSIHIKLSDEDIAALDTLESYIVTGWDPILTAEV